MLSLIALYISSNSHHSGHLAHRFSCAGHLQATKLLSLHQCNSHIHNFTHKGQGGGGGGGRQRRGETTPQESQIERAGRKDGGDREKERLQSSLENSSQLRLRLSEQWSRSRSSSQLIRISAASFWGEGQDVGGLIVFYFTAQWLGCLCRFINKRSCRFTASQQTSISIITGKLLAGTQ